MEKCGFTPFCYSLHQVKTIEDDQRCLSQMLCLRSDVTVMSKKLKSYIFNDFQIWHLFTDDRHATSNN